MPANDFLTWHQRNIMHSSNTAEKQDSLGPVHKLFINWKKAYCVVRRAILCNIIFRLGIHLKLVTLIKVQIQVLWNVTLCRLVIFTSVLDDFFLMSSASPRIVTPRLPWMWKHQACVIFQKSCLSVFECTTASEQ